MLNADIASRVTVGARFGRLTMVMGCIVLVANGGLNRRFRMAERTKAYGDRRQRTQRYERKHEDKDYDFGRASHAKDRNTVNLSLAAGCGGYDDGQRCILGEA